MQVLSCLERSLGPHEASNRPAVDPDAEKIPSHAPGPRRSRPTNQILPEKRRTSTTIEVRT
eukprot:655210-Amphidinium_carterae.1